MRDRRPLAAVLVALSLACAGNAAAESGPMPASGNAMPATQRDDRRLEAGIGGAEPAKPAEPRHFGGVPSRFAAGGVRRRPIRSSRGRT
jgi:hypothetical protein